MHFELWSIGDGSYLFAVLNAVAMIKSYSQIGAIGALIGLLVMGARSALSGGTEFEPKWLLFSALLFSAMFSARVDRVVINEMMPANPNGTPKTYVVDNVPFGPAFIGYMISSMGYAMTVELETAFGSATDTNRITSGGLGHNLTLLTQLQKLGDPTVADKAGELPAYRSTLKAYYHDCTMMGVNQGAIVPEVGMVNNPDPIAAISYPHKLRMTSIYKALSTGSDATGQVEIVPATCEAATNWLRDFTNSRLVEVTNAAMNDSMGEPNMATNAVQALASYGVDVSDKQHELIAASILNSIMAEAQMNGPMSTEQKALELMTQEAIRKRNAQFAGEEGLWVKFMRSAASFFECLPYALAPFMALALGLGRYGFTLIGKWFMVAVWVALWLPLQAMISLYSNSQMTHFLQGLSADTLTSQAHVIMLQDAAINGLATASALSAATPFLAISLIYGGAVAFTSMAGRMQGGDMIDETKMAPNALQTGPIAQAQSDYTHSLGAGTSMTGAAVPTISMGEGLQAAVSSTSQQARSAQEAFAAQSGSMLQHAISVGDSFAKGENVSNDWSQSQAFKTAMGRAVQSASLSGEELDAARQLVASNSLGGGLGVGGEGASLGGKFAAGTQEGEALRSKIAQSLNKVLSEDQSLSRDVASAVRASASTQVGTNGSTSDSQSGTDSLTRTATDVISTSEAYSDARTMSQMMGQNASLEIDKIGANMTREYEARGMTSDDAVDHYTRVINDLGLGDDYRSELSHLRKAGEFLPSASNPHSQELAAISNTLMGAPTSGLEPQQQRALSDARVGFLKEATGIHSATDRLDVSSVHRNEEVGGGVVYGQAEARVEHAALGSGLHGGDVGGRYSAGAAGAAADVHTTTGGLQETFGRAEQTDGRSVRFPEEVTSRIRNAFDADARLKWEKALNDSGVSQPTAPEVFSDIVVGAPTAAVRNMVDAPWVTASLAQTAWNEVAGWSPEQTAASTQAYHTALEGFRHQYPNESELTLSTLAVSKLLHTGVPVAPEIIDSGGRMSEQAQEDDTYTQSMMRAKRIELTMSGRAPTDIATQNSGHVFDGR